MKYLKVVLLGLLLMGSIALKADTELKTAITREQRIELCQEVVSFHKREATLDYNKFRKYMFSGYRVNRMVPNYPANNDYDRMIRFFMFGGLESFWKDNCIVLNVPGAKYSNGRVTRLTVDYTPFGVNEGEVTWTYKVAEAVQKGKPIPRKIGYWRPKPEFIEMMKEVKIPKTLKLKVIDLDLSRQTKEEYYRQKKLIKDPNKLRIEMTKRMPYFECSTQDDIDSTLLYRVIEDMDRMSRGWKHGLELYSPHKYKLYDHLTAFVEENYE